MSSPPLRSPQEEKEEANPFLEEEEEEDEFEEEDEECAWAPGSPTGKQGTDLMAAKRARQAATAAMGGEGLGSPGIFERVLPARTPPPPLSVTGTHRSSVSRSPPSPSWREGVIPGYKAPEETKATSPPPSKSPLDVAPSLAQESAGKHQRYAIPPDSPVKELQGERERSLEIDCSSPRSRKAGRTQSPVRAESPVQPRKAGKAAAGNPIQATRALSGLGDEAYDVDAVRPFVEGEAVSLVVQPRGEMTEAISEPPLSPSVPAAAAVPCLTEEPKWEEEISLDEDPPPTTGAGSFRDAMATVKSLRQQQETLRKDSPPVNETSHVRLPSAPIANTAPSTEEKAKALEEASLHPAHRDFMSGRDRGLKEASRAPVPPPFLVAPVIDYIHDVLNDLERTTQEKNLTKQGIEISNDAIKLQEYRPYATPTLDALHRELNELERSRPGLDALDRERETGDRFATPIGIDERANAVALERLHARVGIKVSNIKDPEYTQS